MQTSTPVANLGEVVMQSSEEDSKWILPAIEARPGTLDSEHFQEGDSVAYWKAYKSPNAEMDSFASKLQEQMADIQAEFGSPQDVPYWSYHLMRTSFFSVQGAVGVLAAQLQGGSLFKNREGGTDLGAALPAAGRLMLEAVAVFSQDYRNIQRGMYKAPYDMDPAHRQFNPAYILDKSQRFISEAVATIKRRDAKASTDVWNQDSSMYPRYFRHTFHYQGDGWFSDESAKVYEASTETLFVGRQDAMQRHTLVPFSKFMQGREEASTRVLEIGCGTGRFHTFLKDSFPKLSTVCSDLSPFYLAEARRNYQYWEQFRGTNEAGPTQFVQANAEDLPYKDASFDCVVSVYMFHELPAPARRAVMAEAARVLVDGGMFILTDSVQLGDRPFQDETIGNFGNFAEPHYRGYIRENFGTLCREFGFVAHEKETASSTKVLSFIKKSSAGGDEPTPGDDPAMEQSVAHVVRPTLAAVQVDEKSEV